MKKTLLSLAIASLAAGQSVCAAVEKVYNEPDSVYIFSYAHPEDEGRSGLKFAWSPDGDKWLSVSDGFAYLKCDFGRWGAEKRMIKPLLEKAEDGRWYCRWQLTPSGKVWGTSHSSDLLKWAPQQYVNAEKPAVPRLVTARQIVLDKDTLNGYMQKVPYADIEQLIRFAEHKKFRDIQNNERTEQDAVRFAGLKPVAATIRVDTGRVKPISEHLIGIFFEDINYGADGGLYAELVQNRDFEYSAKDGARDKNWNSTYAWSIQGTDAELSVSEDSPIHANNAHYAVLEVHRPGAALVNNGFDGIAVKKGEKYDFIADVNSDNFPDLKEAWVGTNSAGFALMNTQSYNLVEVKDGEERGAANGRIIYRALEVCATVEDFCHFLDTITKPSLIEANFGVIDAKRRCRHV